MVIPREEIFGIYIYIYISVVANVIFLKSNEFKWQNFKYSRARIFEKKKISRANMKIWDQLVNECEFFGVDFFKYSDESEYSKKKKTIERIRIFSRIFPDIHSFNFPESEYKNSALFADISSNIDE